MTAWRIALWVAVVFAVLAFLYMVRSVLLPFVVALIIAAMLEPFVRQLRLKGVRTGPAVLCTVLPFYALLFGAGILLAPRIATEVGKLSGQLDGIVSEFTQAGENSNYFLSWDPLRAKRASGGIDGSIDTILTKFHPYLVKLNLPTTRQAFLEQYIEPRRQQITATLQGGVGSFFGFLSSFAKRLFDVFIMLILIPLILMNMPEMRRSVPRWIPPSIRKTTLSLFEDVGHVFQKYLRGVAIVVVLYIICVGILLTLLSVPYGILLAVLFGALYLIPYLGNIMAYGTTFLVVWLNGANGTFFFHVSSPVTYAVIVVACYAAIGMTFDQLVYPQLVGNAVGLNPVVSIFVILCGGTLFGLPGMIIAFPLAGALKIILDRMIRFTTNAQDSLSLPSTPLRHRRTNV